MCPPPHQSAGKRVCVRLQPHRNSICQRRGAGVTWPLGRFLRHQDLEQIPVWLFFVRLIFRVDLSDLSIGFMRPEVTFEPQFMVYKRISLKAKPHMRDEP